MATILFVDDVEAVRITSTRLLERAGYTVLPAKSGAQALELFGTHVDTIALVITDISMPGISGSELAQRIRERAPTLPVILTSAYPHDTGDSSYIYLTKPFTAGVLLSAVKQALG
jgi:CheY-like chemotaxis protein